MTPKPRATRSWTHIRDRYGCLYRIPLKDGSLCEFGFTKRSYPLRLQKSCDLKHLKPSRLKSFSNYTSSAYPIQVHSNRILDIRSKQKLKQCGRADGLLTDQSDLRLMIVTADCLPIYLWCDHSVAIVHAGWRGTRRGILKTLVKRACRKHRMRAADLWAAFGPVIRAPSYEVGTEFKRLFPKSTRKRGGKLTFDLVLENRRQLVELGVPQAHLIDLGYDTYSQKRLFHSYRRDRSRAGRMISWIGKPSWRQLKN